MHITDPHASVLLELVSRAPAIVGRDDLAKAGWGGVATQNSIEQAISRIRKTLADIDRTVFIETVASRGYRFVAPIERRERAGTVAADDASDELLRTLLHGHRELTTLNREAIDKARTHFEQAIRHDPHYAPARVGLALTCALAFEASRMDTSCDLKALACAVEHARRATQLDASDAEAWSTLGFALHLTGQSGPATVAALKAVTFDRDSWRLWLRLAYVSWGEDRLKAAQTTLTLGPDLALASWLKATVLIARGAFEPALTHVRAGCTAQDRQSVSPVPYPAVGLHLLHGLVLAAQERLAEAADSFHRELAGPDRGQLYARECQADSWYALGAIRLRQGDVGAANVAFRRALEIAPGHLFSMAALGLPMPALAPDDPRIIDANIARAIALARAGRHREAADAYRDTVASSAAANAGWRLPVEPVLHVSARPEIWGDALALVQQRAT